MSTWYPAASGLRRPSGAQVTTVVLIGVNVLVWLAILVTGSGSSPVLRTLSLTPLGTCLLAADPGRYLPGVTAAQCATVQGMAWSPGVAGGAWWQVLTSAFTHVQVWHVGFNMVALAILGPTLERAIGRARFLGLYVTAALTGAAAVMWFSRPDGSTYGASGAVFGLMGGLLIVAWRTHGDVRGVLVWLGLNVAFTFLNSGVSWQGHLGGLAGGLLVGALLSIPGARRASVQWLGVGALAFVTVVLIAARAVSLAG
ncbi:MAG: rhomboid family intramembrane serine protease [Actinomycetia bacterium]|nr:rhomboid family intramembrane serine protease [Actinomycetes bacterium]